MGMWEQMCRDEEDVQWCRAGQEQIEEDGGSLELPLCSVRSAVSGALSGWPTVKLLVGAT